MNIASEISDENICLQNLDWSVCITFGIRLLAVLPRQDLPSQTIIVRMELEDAMPSNILLSLV